MGCLAQISPDPKEFTVSPSGPCICDPFREGPNLRIDMVRIDCFIIRGTVLCGSTITPNDVVVNAIVFATGIVNGLKRTFACITNSQGQYSICVPAGTYSLEAYLCCPNCLESVNCTCCFQ